MELLDTLEVDRVVLGGASMGAATALHSACFRPERVAALVLVIPPAAWETRHDQSKRYRGGARYTLTHGVHSFAKATRKLPNPEIFCDRLECLCGGGIGAIDDFHYLPLVAALRGAAGSDLPSPSQLAHHPGHPHAGAGLGHRRRPTPSRRPRPWRRRFEHADLHVARTPADVDAWSDEVAHFLADCE